jgi:hypothetical protein
MVRATLYGMLRPAVASADTKVVESCLRPLFDSPLSSMGRTRSILFPLPMRNFTSFQNAVLATLRRTSPVTRGGRYH